MSDLNKKPDVIGPVRNEAIEVLGHVQMDNEQSIIAASQAFGVSRSSILRILKKCKFHQFKIMLFQKLLEDDFDHPN